MDEFELIRRYFDRCSEQSDVLVGIGDDGAVLQPNPRKQQVQVIDTLLEGVHFPANTAAADIGYRAVAVNLSDLAAMGARPRWMTLALTLADSDHDWLESFASGMFQIADECKVALVGGDTTRGPVTTVTIAMTGDVDAGQAILRTGAKIGEGIYVTGTVGDASAGLSLLLDGKMDEHLVGRFLRPTPRLEIGAQLSGRASAAIDVSDGLAGDLLKLLTRSQVGGEIELEKLPLSQSLLQNFDESEQRDFALTGGDDYELCFTANVENVSGIGLATRIGTVVASPGLVCRLGADVVGVDSNGYRHFSSV